ncbi:MAG: MFS transporter [Chitinophagaceae bacterium]|nr:MFS transporter [Chitinophagaceae bacterium]
MFRQITRTVWIISIISLLNDFSSEMLYPVIPLYLQQIGYGTLVIGILEGVAECIAGLMKIYSGSLSDRFEKRLPFVQLGYALSILSRPLIGFTSSLGLIFTGRSLDRIGKGIRGGARDALLADECSIHNRAEIFGFHRSMDTAGAVLGPLVAMIYLGFYPEAYRALFLITLVPGILAILFTFWIKEKTALPKEKKTFSIRENFSFWKAAPLPYRRFLPILLLFTLFNSSDMFLLLKAKDAGLNDQQVLMLYLLFNVVFSLMAFPVGKLADRLGKTKMLIFGLMIYALTYSGFAFAHTTTLIIISFICYGLFYAFTQGIIKALLISKVGSDQKSNAVGFYDGINSISLLLTNALAGWIWYQFGATTLFVYTAIGAACVAILLFRQFRKG